MKTTDATTPPPTDAVASDSDNVQIAVATFTPFDCSGIPRDVAESLRGLGMDNAFVLITIGQLMQAALHREGIPCEALLPLGTAFDGAIQFETPVAFRVDALKATVEFCEGCFWLDKFASVCWRLCSEDLWRAHRNASTPIQLHKFFTTESNQIHLAALKKTALVLESVKAHMDDLDSLPGES